MAILQGLFEADEILAQKQGHIPEDLNLPG
jgi:hypothetical protein